MPALTVDEKLNAYPLMGKHYILNKLKIELFVPGSVNPNRLRLPEMRLGIDKL